MAKRTPNTAMADAMPDANARNGITQPQQDFLTPEEAEVSVAGATATLVKGADGRKILHVQVPLDFGALRCRVAAKGEKAPTSAYLPFQARLDTPKGVRVGGNIHVPFALLHAATIANAVENWRAAQAKAKAQREKAAEEDREKLG